ncbi:MAG: hypothetical protein OQJ78_01175 [Ignavibacteriaceae bacterium]|jgi:hypothetical protein|nr:hypothetical protein [Ignavibacteriaceae bacterium]
MKNSNISSKQLDELIMNEFVNKWLLDPTVGKLVTAVLAFLFLIAIIMLSIIKQEEQLKINCSREFWKKLIRTVEKLILLQLLSCW